MSLSLRSKLSLTLGGLLTVVLSVGFLGIYWSERSAILKKTAEGQAALLAQFAQTCTDALAVDDELALLNAAAALQRIPTVRQAYCRDGRGRVLGEGPSNPSAKSDLRLFRQSIRVRSGKQAEAVIAYSNTAVEAEVRQSLQGAARRIVSVSVVTLGVGILAALVVAGQLIRPLQKIAWGTRQIAAGRLSYRLHLGRGDELGRLADDFDRMAERLGELDRMKEDFVSNVTHELRSPLSAIQSYVNLMTEDFRAGRHGNTMDHLTVVRNNATRLAKFVNDILDLAKIEAGSGKLRLTSVPVFEILLEVETLFRLKARENAISLTVAPPDPALTAHADEGAVHQIITNLVSNALKFTPAGGQVTLSATSTVSSANDPLLAQSLNNADPDHKNRIFMRLSVSDTGRGIDRESLARIFDRFEQVKEAKDSVKGLKGSGLGLAISRGLAEAQGGKLLAESVPGQGSVFSLYLPKVQ